MLVLVMDGCLFVSIALVSGWQSVLSCRLLTVSSYDFELLYNRVRSIWMVIVLGVYCFHDVSISIYHCCVTDSKEFGCWNEILSVVFTYKPPWDCATMKVSFVDVVC